MNYGKGENKKMTEIKLYKSITNDYFVLQKNSDVPFYFNKEDLIVLIEKLNELNEEIFPVKRASNKLRDLEYK